MSCQLVDKVQDFDVKKKKDIKAKKTKPKQKRTQN